jgi:hypothetical protein
MIKKGDRVTYGNPQLQAYDGIIVGIVAEMPGFVLVQWAAPIKCLARERANRLMSVGSELH